MMVWLPVGLRLLNTDDDEEAQRKSGAFGIRFMLEFQMQMKYSLNLIIYFFMQLKFCVFICLMVIFNI